MVQNRTCYLFFYNVWKELNVVIIADLESLDSNMKKKPLLLKVKWNLSVSLFKAEVAVDSKLEMKIVAGILPQEPEHLSI